MSDCCICPHSTAHADTRLAAVAVCGVQQYISVHCNGTAGSDSIARQQRTANYFHLDACAATASLSTVQQLRTPYREGRSATYHNEQLQLNTFAPASHYGALPWRWTWGDSVRRGQKTEDEYLSRGQTQHTGMSGSRTHVFIDPPALHLLHATSVSDGLTVPPEPSAEDRGDCWPRGAASEVAHTSYSSISTSPPAALGLTCPHTPRGSHTASASQRSQQPTCCCAYCASVV